MEKFWMLYVPGGNAPNRRHGTLAEAKAEAERLLAQPSITEVYVLAVVAVAKRAVAPIAWEGDAGYEVQEGEEVRP